MFIWMFSDIKYVQIKIEFKPGEVPLIQLQWLYLLPMRCIRCLPSGDLPVECCISTVFSPLLSLWVCGRGRVASKNHWKVWCDPKKLQRWSSWHTRIFCRYSFLKGRTPSSASRKRSCHSRIWKIFWRWRFLLQPRALFHFRRKVKQLFCCNLL